MKRNATGWMALGIAAALGAGREASADQTFSAPEKWAEELTATQGWGAEHPRLLADVNGDGRQDVVGFGNDGVWVAASTGANFQPRFALADLGYNQGWRVGRHVRLAGDINGDHLDDIVGFGNPGVFRALATSSGFGPATFVIADFGYDQGWRPEKHVRLLADVDGDRRKDIVAFGDHGVWLALATSSGTFSAPVFAIADFGVDHGWTPAKHVRTTADVNGDGRQDIVAFGDQGVWIALSTGAGFASPQFVLANFGVQAGGWTIDHPRLLADIDRDGKDDIVAFGDRGVWIARSSGAGFSAPQLVLPDFGMLSVPGWPSAIRCPRFVADLDGDRYPDIVGYGPDAIYRSLGGPAGFRAAERSLPEYVASLSPAETTPRLVGDVSGDGKRDLISFSTAGIQVARSFDRPPPAGRVCPQTPAPCKVEIREADPAVDKAHHDAMRQLLIESVAQPNRTVLLGPNVVLDFSDATDEEIPVGFGACVTLASTSAFGAGAPPELPICGSAARPAAVNARAALPAEPSARTPHSPGPLLRFGSHSQAEHVFLSVGCPEGFPPNDNVRISGFRLYGPSFGQQTAEDIGIHVVRCLGTEISNMEIAGFGGQGIAVLDDNDGKPGPGQEQPDNRPGERIGRPDQVRIFHNYIHHNQRPRGIFDDHASGYGVEINHGAWGQIFENLFDFNRHAIAAAGNSGGYQALRNLVLKGGGVHFDTGTTIHTHEFDIHGTGPNGFGGQASVQTLFANNSFQYLNGHAIEVRARPALRVDIRDNVFAHEGFEDDEGDDAVSLNDRADRDVIILGPNNRVGFDSYGRYGVCDFDGDGVDDLFLATGQTWWFSSFGEFPWSYLASRTETLDQVRLGYFDADQRCDVLAESDGQWVIASGGTGPWQSIGSFGAPLAEVAFGRFDPNIRDHRPGVTRRTTHAFRRAPSGDWLVTPLAAPNWQPVQSSSFPMEKLRFGDFTGDGVTDALAVQGGRWSISQSGRGSWQTLNPNLSDDVRSLFIADLNNNNIDDLIRLERKEVTSGPPGKPGTVLETFNWWVSDDGRSPWRLLKTYKFSYSSLTRPQPAVAFAGRFGVAPGGGVLLIDHDRTGRFYSEAETRRGAAPDWMSLFSF